MASSIDNTTSETFPRDWEVYEKRIAELQAENQQLTTTIVELRKGLEPFARFAERIPNCYKSPKPHISNKLISYLFRDDSHSPSVQDVMNARALLQSTNPGEGLMEELGQLRGNVDACHEEMQRLTSELAAAREELISLRDYKAKLKLAKGALQLAYRLPRPWMNGAGISYEDWNSACEKIDAALAELEKE